RRDRTRRPHGVRPHAARARAQRRRQQRDPAAAVGRTLRGEGLMPVRRKIQPLQTKPKLFGDLARVLLSGGGDLKDVPIPGVPEADNPFDIFMLTEADLKDAWRQHRSRLLQIWRRLGETGEPWAAREFDHPSRGTTV